MNGPLREDKKIEYGIRKYQRALSMIQKTDYMAGDVMPGQAFGGETVKRENILESTKTGNPMASLSTGMKMEIKCGRAG